MKRWQKIGILAGVFLVALAVVKDMLIQTVVSTVGSQVIGAPFKVGAFSLGVTNQKVRIKNMRLYNPPGFPQEVLIDIPEISVDFDLPALAGGKLHLPLLVINLKEMVVIKNTEGELNVDSLKVVKEQKAAADQKKVKDSGQKKLETKPAVMPLKIDQMTLNVGRVVYKDYSKGEPPEIQVFDVALKNKTFRDIQSAEQLVTLVMVQAMGPTAIQGAKVYAAATLLGVGFLPAGVVGLLIGQDDSSAHFDLSYDRVYAGCLAVAQASGEVKSEDQASGVIKAKADGADITIRIEKESAQSTKVVVAARKLLMPKPEIAGGVIYKIQQKLK